MSGEIGNDGGKLPTPDGAKVRVKPVFWAVPDDGEGATQPVWAVYSGDLGYYIVRATYAASEEGFYGVHPVNFTQLNELVYAKGYKLIDCSLGHPALDEMIAQGFKVY